MADTNSTYLSYPQTKAHAEEIVACKDAMNGIFSDFGAEMARVGGEDAFVGDASESLKQRYDSLKQKFDDYCNLVQQFADNITGASEETAYMERQMAAQAEQLQG
jgi:uncharacterized protein YukE